MNTKDIAEIRRRFRPEKSNISRIRGCYVNDTGEIIATFNQSLGLMDEDEAGELLGILKKVLSGQPGKNLHDVTFSTQQVLESEEHQLLAELRSSGLDNNTAVDAFYAKVIEAAELEGSYMILLAADKYDIAGYGADGTKDEDSTKSFSYFVCCICPVKQTKPALGYLAEENRFCNLASDWVIAAPEIGFMFPAYERRAANIYSSLYYTHSTAENRRTLCAGGIRQRAAPPGSSAEGDLLRHFSGKRRRGLQLRGRAGSTRAALRAGRGEKIDP